MSLDITLIDYNIQVQQPVEQIFIREDGMNKQISRTEWDERFPDKEPFIICTDKETENHVVYTANITHNLGKMADEAGIYKYVWHPEEFGITTAGELIEPLRKGLTILKASPTYFQQFNASNEWGTYEQFIPFVENYLKACETYPHAEISVSR